jgi:hypothetical protein
MYKSKVKLNINQKNNFKQNLLQIKNLVIRKKIKKIKKEVKKKKLKKAKKLK